MGFILPFANAFATGVSTATGVKSLAAGGAGAGGPCPVPLATKLSFGFIPQPSVCQKESPDANTFLSCWRHPVPDNFIPAWDSQKCGWLRWLYCPGAKGGRAPAGGCQPGCNCTGKPCECAPVGTVIAIPGQGTKQLGNVATKIPTTTQAQASGVQLAPGATNPITQALAQNKKSALVVGGLAAAVIVAKALL